MDTYNPPETYEQVFVEHPPPTQPSVSPCPQKHVPAQTSIPSEWHRHGSTSQPSSSLPESSVFFIFMSAQFSALQSKMESKFAVFEQKVDTKLNQLQVHLERHITKYAYNHDNKMH